MDEANSTRYSDMWPDFNSPMPIIRIEDKGVCCVCGSVISVIASLQNGTDFSPCRAGVEVPRGTNITNDSGKNIGKLITHLEGIGLALLRVKEM